MKTPHDPSPRTIPVPEEVNFDAMDGARLSGTLFEPDGPVRGSVVLASAMGVRRKLYRGFAGTLAHRGLRVLTFDYRGIGDSRTRENFQRTTLADWGKLDVVGAHAYLRTRAPKLPLAHVGHSVGGQLLALAPEGTVDAALLIASQSGYFRHWPAHLSPLMGALWYLTPSIVAIWKRLPMKALGQGDDVPPGVARQWAEWGRDPRYIGKYLAEASGSEVSPHVFPLRMCAIADDGYAPPRAVRALAKNFELANPELVTLKPTDFGVPTLGHFGVFREKLGKAVWEQQADWLSLALASRAKGDAAKGTRAVEAAV